MLAFFLKVIVAEMGSIKLNQMPSVMKKKLLAYSGTFAQYLKFPQN
jgi:hypothetical protein